MSQPREPGGRRRAVDGRMRLSREQLALELARRSDGDLLALTPETPEAFEVFYRRHAQGVLSYLAYRTGNTQVALDLTSEVFVAALAGRGRFRPEKGPGRAWLFGIVNNKLAGEHRRRALERAARRRLGVHWFEFSDEALEQAEDVIDASEAGFLRGLEGLSAAEREAVTARILDERDYPEIATTENASEAAIRQRVHRGLAKLRRLGQRGQR